MGWASNAACHLKRPTAVFSLEMPAKQLVARELCAQARIDVREYRAGRMPRGSAAEYAVACERVHAAPLFIDDTPAVSLMQVRARSRQLKAREGDLALVLIDYLQLMRSGLGHESREAEVSEISRGLKALSKELDCPIVALSQLNRDCEKRADKRPTLSDLRESGAIEQDADAIAFVYRDEVYNNDSPDRGVAEIIIGKQRSGPTGTVRVRFFNEYTRFDNLADDSWGAPNPEDFSDEAAQ
jgi:replicative DNA helicase